MPGVSKLLISHCCSGRAGARLHLHQDQVSAAWCPCPGPRGRTPSKATSPPRPLRLRHQDAGQASHPGVDVSKPEGRRHGGWGGQGGDRAEEGCGRPWASPGDKDTWQMCSQECPGPVTGSLPPRSVHVLGWLGTSSPRLSVWEEKSMQSPPAPPGPPHPPAAPHPRGGIHVAHTVRNALSKEGAAGRNGKTRSSSRKGVTWRLHPLSPGGEDPPTYPEEVGGESEWIKCLIPTAHPSVRLRRESGRGYPRPLPHNPATFSPQPLIAVLPSERWGPPRGPEGQSWVSPKHPAVLGRGGRVWGNWCAPPSTPPLPVPYILERHPLPGASAQRGTTVCTLISPQSGHSRGGALQQGPQKDCSPGRGGGSGGGGASTSGPLRLHRGPPSAKHFPLSRSKNTKLGTPGAPHPGAPAPFPPPPQGGHLGWGG